MSAILPLRLLRNPTLTHPHFPLHKPLRLPLASTSRLPPFSTHHLPRTRPYSTPSPSLLYAGPRSSRSFRRDRKETQPSSASNADPSAEGQEIVQEPYIPTPRQHPQQQQQQYQQDAGILGGTGYDPTAFGTGFGGGGAGGAQIQHDPKGVLRETDGAMRLLENEALVIVRQLEMLNVFIGFEQQNRYAIMNPLTGEHVGYMVEEDQGILGAVSRQVLRTHRPFKSIVMDKEGKPILWIRRPFAFINSRIYVHSLTSPTTQLHTSPSVPLAAQSSPGEALSSNQLGGGPIIGEAQQDWHPWRRRYNVFKHREDTFKQFAAIDSGLWAWTFILQNAEGRPIASIDRNFAGLARELFTDTGQYVIRFDAVDQELSLPSPSSSPSTRPTLQLSPKSSTDLTLDERAMVLATAVTIDIDYFSRHSGSGGMGFPFFMWGGGGDEYRRDGSVAGGDVAGGAAGAVGAGGMGDVAAGAGMGAAMGMGRGMYPNQDGGEAESDRAIYGQDDEVRRSDLEGDEAEAGRRETLDDPWAGENVFEENQEEGLGFGDVFDDPWE